MVKQDAKMPEVERLGMGANVPETERLGAGAKVLEAEMLYVGTAMTQNQVANSLIENLDTLKCVDVYIAARSVPLPTINITATYPVKPTTPLHPCIRSSWSLRWKSNDGAALNDLSVVSPARAHARVVTPSASNGAAPTTVPVTSAFLPFAKDKAVAEGAVAAALPELALAPAEKDAVTSAIEVDWKPYLDAGSNNGVLGSQRGVQNGVKPASTASEGQAAPFPPQTNRKAQRCWSRELQCPPNPQRCPRYACIYYSHTWKSSLNYLEKNTRCMHYCELKTNKNLFVLCKSGDPEADP
ncbi:uncharacterized protein LOC133925459 [Phragmites australis]|uniref:uncharacterized protein LOC133925459 n=1 Tax=Phragmites australis TaxID=29695 RepID=UPI002D77A66A|nr:uncharacterized protein LOC133925459 [Phragmites australis]